MLRIIGTSVEPRVTLLSTHWSIARDNLCLLSGQRQIGHTSFWELYVHCARQKKLPQDSDLSKTTRIVVRLDRLGRILSYMSEGSFYKKFFSELTDKPSEIFAILCIDNVQLKIRGAELIHKERFMLETFENFQKSLENRSILPNGLTHDEAAVILGGQKKSVGTSKSRDLRLVLPPESHAIEIHIIERDQNIELARETYNLPSLRSRWIQFVQRGAVRRQGPHIVTIQKTGELFPSATIRFAHDNSFDFTIYSGQALLNGDQLLLPMSQARLREVAASEVHRLQEGDWITLGDDPNIGYELFFRRIGI